MENRKIQIGAIILTLIVCGIVTFVNLGAYTVRLWDEGRLAVNALEMYESGLSWVTTFGHQPDMWNTKPPLMIWLQVLSLKTFGLHDWALRIPSVIAALGTYWVLYRFCKKELNHFWLGICSVLVLASTHDYVIEHVTRTGDFDALLILWTTLAGLRFFAYTETGKSGYLYQVFIFLGLAVLTKSIAGLLFVPMMLAWLWARKKMIPTLKSKHTYIGFFLFLALTLGYYIIREYYNPGYVKAVMDNELGGRYFNTLENHQERWYWYIRRMIQSDFIYWLCFIPVGGLLLYRAPAGVQKRGVFYCGLLAVGFLLIVSLSQTKLLWYHAPIFPFLAVCIAYSVVSLWAILRQRALSRRVKILAYAVGLACLAWIMGINIRTEISVYDPFMTDHQCDINYLLRDKYIRTNASYQLKVVHEEYSSHLSFYVATARMQNRSLVFADKGSLVVGDTVLLREPYLMEHQYIAQSFRYTVIDSFYQARLIVLEDRIQ